MRFMSALYQMLRDVDGYWKSDTVPRSVPATSMLKAAIRYTAHSALSAYSKVLRDETVQDM